jgi:cyclopropane fatty-acyl-phospholipid synthase-like methyltransferase
MVHMSSFDERYKGNPPWDIGRAQSEVITIEEEGKIWGRVLDVGCGTGENTLYLAERGYQVMGVDLSPRAIAKARDKAEARGLEVNFVVHDALQLDILGLEFDTVIDSGLFHVFNDEDRSRFAESVAGVLTSGGYYHMLSFSDLEPGDWGPRRVKAEEIRASFVEGWRVEGIAEACFETNFEDICAMAWLATLIRE